MSITEISAIARPDLAVIIDALGFAARKHRDQRRKDHAASPYINHPIALVEVLCNEAGVTEPAVLRAALLHDTIEDTQTTAVEIETLFGIEVCGIVLEVTDDKGLTKAERKRAQVERAGRVSREARLVKLADKICNLRDVAQPAGGVGPGPPPGLLRLGAGGGGPASRDPRRARGPVRRRLCGPSLE